MTNKKKKPTKPTKSFAAAKNPGIYRVGHVPVVMIASPVLLWASRGQRIWYENIDPQPDDRPLNVILDDIAGALSRCMSPKGKA